MDKLLAPPAPVEDTKAVFGVSLEEGVRRSGRLSPDLPDVLTVCLATLEKDGLTEVGLFRVPGSMREVAQLRSRFQRGEVPDTSTLDDVHVVTSLVKLYLRELPECIFTPRSDAEAAYQKACASDPRDYRTMLECLSPCSRKALHALFSLLVKVCRTHRTHRVMGFS